MANIKITEIQPNKAEFSELSSSDLEAIIGGLFGIRTPKFLKKLDDIVHDNGGWSAVAGVGILVYTGNPVTIEF